MSQQLDVSSQVELDMSGDFRGISWFRPILEKTREKRATDITILQNTLVRIGRLKEYTIASPDIAPSRRQIEEFITETRGELASTDDEPGNRRYFNKEYGFSVKGIGRFRVSATISVPPE